MSIKEELNHAFMKRYTPFDSESYNEYLSEIIAILRDYIDYDKVSKRVGHDITGELMAAPEYVLYYLAEYINMLEEESE